MVSDAQMEMMEKHLELVIQMNTVTNITRIESLEEGRLLHIEDSLTALPELEEAPQGQLADIGTGAGYPGIPLAIATGRKTTLVEMRKKKADILEEMISKLGLENQIDVYCGRAELLARKIPSSYTVVTARALSKMSVLMELASPLLSDNGLLICYKAHIDKEEYDNAKRVQITTGMKLVSDRSITLGDEAIERRIVCFKKATKPKMKLPRKEGMAQNHPL